MLHKLLALLSNVRLLVYFLYVESACFGLSKWSENSYSCKQIS